MAGKRVEERAVLTRFWGFLVLFFLKRLAEPLGKGTSSSPLSPSPRGFAGPPLCRASRRGRGVSFMVRHPSVFPRGGGGLAKVTTFRIQHLVRARH